MNKNTIAILAIACLLIASVAFFLPATGMFFTNIVLVLGIAVAAMCVFTMVQLFFKH